MARGAIFTAEDLHHVAARLALLLAGAPQAELRPPGGKIALETALEVFFLPLDAVRQPGATIEKAMVSTHRYRHQLLVNGRAIGEVTTTRTQPAGSPLKIATFGLSPIAEAVDAAIGWIDAHVADEAHVVFLAVPALYTEALWIRDADNPRMIILRRPDELGALPIGSPISEASFIAAAAAAGPFGRGVGQ